MKMDNLLNGLSFGSIQKVGVMSIIPLIGEDVSTPMGTMNDITFNGTHTYGTMMFTNNGEKPVILPTGISMISTEKAQDHGSPFAYLLKPNSKEDVKFTCCIERHQPGYLTGKGIKGFNILPLFVRKKHFENYLISDHRSYHSSFSNLWSIITEFQSQLVGKNEAHLVYFFTKFVEQLNKFNAEFESIPNQRGAIILLNEKIVGIEITPTNEYWKSIWQQLVRDCYGSEVIRLTFLNLIKEFKNHNELTLDLSTCKSIEDIEKVIQEFEQNQLSSIDSKLQEILNKEFKEIEAIDTLQQVISRNEYNSIEYSVVKAVDKTVFGELYKKEDEVLYCSLLLS